MSLEPSRPETLQYEQYGATTVLALEFGRVQYLEVIAEMVTASLLV
jgi:hypothetical protein